MFLSEKTCLVTTVTTVTNVITVITVTTVTMLSKITTIIITTVKFQMLLLISCKCHFSQSPTTERPTNQQNNQPTGQRLDF